MRRCFVSCKGLCPGVLLPLFLQLERGAFRTSRSLPGRRLQGEPGGCTGTAPVCRSRGRRSGVGFAPAPFTAPKGCSQTRATIPTVCPWVGRDLAHRLTEPWLPLAPAPPGPHCCSPSSHLLLASGVRVVRRGQGTWFWT